MTIKVWLLLKKTILKVLMWYSQQEFSEQLYMGQKKGETEDGFGL